MYWLIVHLFINGAWIEGDKVLGWDKFLMKDKATCEQAIKNGLQNSLNTPLEGRVKFECIKRK